MMRNSNKVIAKNSFYLYTRTLLSTIVSLYTSRIFLEAIGIEDYGIYNLVGGIVAFFALLQSLMAGATQRFLNVEIGKNNYEQENKILDISIIINMIIAISILILGETVGLWIIENKLNLPAGKERITFMVYHISILTTMTSVIKVPYNAYILAHERMSFFAYISLAEIIVKLIITAMLFYFKERLIPYCLMLLFMNLLTLWGYRLFCQRDIGLGRFKVHRLKGNPEYKTLLSFSGWTLVGNGATVARDQGISIIINMFLGVTLNAAIGVMTQISNVYSSLYQNLQAAFMPQIVQNSESDKEQFNSLVKYCVTFTFILMGSICVPMIAHTDFILHTWLGNNVPQYAGLFVQIIMIKILFVSTSQAVYHALLAVGKIKETQIWSCLLSAVSIGATYCFLSFGMNPAFAIATIACMDLIMLFIRLFYINLYTNIKATELMSILWKPYTAIFLTIIPLAFVMSNEEYTWGQFFLSTLCIEIIYLILISFTIDKVSRNRIICKISQYIKLHN